MPLRVLARLEPWELYAAGADACDDLLGRLGLAPVDKAIGVLSRAGYDRATRALLRAIAAEVRRPDRAAIQRAAAKLDADWPKMTPAQRSEIIEAASKSILQVPKVIAPKLRKVIPRAAAQIVEDAKKAAREEHGLAFAPAFTEIDQRIVDHAGTSQALYVTDVYGERSKLMSATAREIVASGLEQGLGREEIGRELGRQLIDPLARTADSYWSMVAAVHTTRARTWGLLSSFSDAGITSYTWEAVNDEATCDVCDFMDGRRFDVAAAVKTWQDVEGADDPQDVEHLQPWVRVAQDEDGNRTLFVDKRGTRHALARVVRSSEGRKDTAGRYSHAVSDEHLQGLGVDSPPVHGNCRCTLVPS